MVRRSIITLDAVQMLFIAGRIDGAGTPRSLLHIVSPDLLRLTCEASQIELRHEVVTLFHARRVSVAVRVFPKCLQQVKQRLIEFRFGMLRAPRLNSKEYFAGVCAVLTEVSENVIYVLGRKVVSSLKSQYVLDKRVDDITSSFWRAPPFCRAVVIAFKKSGQLTDPTPPPVMNCFCCSAPAPLLKNATTITLNTRIFGVMAVLVV